MTTTTTKKAADKAADGSATEHLQEAMRDIDKARQAAQGEVRTQLDCAYDRVRDTVAELRDRAGGDLGAWEDSLERASDHLRVELGLRAVRAQRSTEGLTQMAGEIRKRKAELTA
jgi:uncharacterized protein YbjQ (UPF0145 family)